MRPGQPPDRIVPWISLLCLHPTKWGDDGTGQTAPR